MSRLKSLMVLLGGDQRVTLSRVTSAAGFLTLFIGVKVVALIGILWLARVSSPEVFGAVELSLAVSLMVAGIGLLGVPGAATRLALTLNQPEIDDLLAFAALVVCLPASGAAIAVLVVGGPPVWVLLLASCAAACFQTIASTWARVRRRPLVNSIVDPFTILSVLLVGAGLRAFDLLTVINLAKALTILSIFLTVGLVVLFSTRRGVGFAARYKNALIIAGPILALGGVSILVSSALRPVLGGLFSLQALAVYSLCFRLTAPCMLLHQVFATAFFARIYQAGDRRFDQLAAGLAVACLAIIGALLLVMRPMIETVFPAYAASVEIMAHLFPLVGLQVLLWILNALLEMRVARHGVAGRAAVLGYMIFGVGIGAIILLRPDTLAQATAIFTVSLLLFATGQIVMLRSRGERLPLMFAVAILASLCCWGMAATWRIDLAGLFR